MSMFPKKKKTCWKENVIFQHLPTNHQFLGNWLVFRGPHITLSASAGSREWRTCWAREAARKTLGSPCGVSFWSGKGWGFFLGSEIPKWFWCRNHGRNDVVCQALWYGVRFLRQFTSGHCHMGKVFGGYIYIYTCLNCILLPSWQSTGVNQPSTWISTADAQDKSPDTPKWASSSQTWRFSWLPDRGTDLQQDLFPINFPGQKRRSLWDHHSLHGFGASASVLRWWDMYNDIGEELVDLVPDHAVVLWKSRSQWKKCILDEKKVDSLYCAYVSYVNSWCVRDNHIDPYHWVITACP